MKAVVLAAGQGTRLRPVTDTRPKPLVPVGGKPIIEHVLEVSSQFVDGYILVVGYQEEKVKSYIGSSFNDIPVQYVTQEKQDGTARAVAKAKKHVAERFLVLNGDVIFDESLVNSLASTIGHVVATKEVNNPSNYGVVSIEDGKLTNLVEKPTDPPTNLANLGLYAFEPTIFDAIDTVERSERGEYEITDAIEYLISTKDSVNVVEHYGDWLDVGYPWDVLDATELLLRDQVKDLGGDVNPSATIVGDVVVEPGAKIRSGVTIEGPTLVKSGADVGPNAYIRGTSVIGEDVHVGHGVEIKNSVLFDGASVPHLSYVGDSILGSDVNFGAGTNVANLRHDDRNVRVIVKGEPINTGRRKFGVVCGDNVKTGINTSLNPGTKLPTNYRTRPGEVVTKDPSVEE